MKRIEMLQIFLQTQKTKVTVITALGTVLMARLV